MEVFNVINKVLIYLNLDEKLRNKLYLIVSLVLNVYLWHLVYTLFRASQYAHGVLVALLTLGITYFLLLNIFYWFFNRAVSWDISGVLYRLLRKEVHLGAKVTLIDVDEAYLMRYVIAHRDQIMQKNTKPKVLSQASRYINMDYDDRYHYLAPDFGLVAKMDGLWLVSDEGDLVAKLDKIGKEDVANLADKTSVVLDEVYIDGGEYSSAGVEFKVAPTLAVYVVSKANKELDQLRLSNKKQSKAGEDSKSKGNTNESAELFRLKMRKLLSKARYVGSGKKVVLPKDTDKPKASHERGLVNSRLKAKGKHMR